VGSVAILLGLALYVGTLVLIRNWINATPARLWAIAKQERERDERKELDALQEATAAKVGAITRALREHGEQITADLRAQMAAAETRARMAETRVRVAEREASNATSMLAIASELLRDVRSTHQGLGELPALIAELRALAKTGPATLPAPPPEGDDETRKTVEMRPPASCTPPGSAEGEDEPEEELTQVASRPAALPVPASSSGLRISPRAAPPPASGGGAAR
jgi:hypothetical protein